MQANTNTASKNGLGLWSLVCLGVGSIIGSGWLFAAYKTAKYAAGGALFVWLIGAFVVTLLALIISELATLYPKTGLFGRVLAISHNKDMGYITAMVNWFGILAVIPTEAMATIQYLAKAKPDWNNYFFLKENLTGLGLLIVSCLVMLYSLMNYWGVSRLAKSNNIITFFKVMVPALTAIVILFTVFHPGNFTIDGGKLLPHGLGSVFTAIMSGGIVYAFNGFQTIASFCSEARNPGKDIPRALLISIAIGLSVYLLLQTAFIGGVPQELLSNGWQGLLLQSPIVELTGLLGLHVIGFLLYADACLSPSGTGIVYTGATCRMLTAMAQEKQAPAFFDHFHTIFQFSRRALIFNLGLALTLLWFFKSWESLMVICSLFNVISYLACPIALMRLRITNAHAERPFRLPLAHIICPLFFLFATILICLVPEGSLMLVTSLLIAAYIMYIFISNQANVKKMKKAVLQSYSLMLYFVVLTGISFLGNPQGGLDCFSGQTFYILACVTGLVFYYWLVYGNVGLVPTVLPQSPDKPLDIAE